MITIFNWLPTLMAMFTLYGGGGGKGGSKASQQTSQTVTQTNIPEYARPYVQRLLGKTEAITDLGNNPYQQYTGQRIAGFSPMQQQAFGNIQGQGVAEQIGAASSLAGGAGLASLGAGQQYASQATNPGAIGQYMNPFMQIVVDQQKSEANRDYNRQLQDQRAKAVGQGAFGGSRQAIAEAEGARNLQGQLGSIQGKGLYDAYENAMKNLQFGSTLGLQGAGQAVNAANSMGQMGKEEFAQQQQIINNLMSAGGQQQALAQQGLDTTYQDFQNQQNYPYKQLSFMSDMLRGLPLSQTAQSQYAPQPSTASQLGGLGLAGLGLYGAMK